MKITMMGKKLIPTLQENLRHNKRGLENLLAEQIMFCNRLLLTRNDRLPFDIISAVAKAIHPLNPPWMCSRYHGEILN